ncbi:DUF3949 domain-containing protein [Halobacillus sp. Marseille-P3879]|uniref:DUF3949 domain-containing protein n=1 Tax=Halobacillus sp. Marseille-P3879 TaxID=2045014 RepID=UPI000C79F0A9
MEPFFLCNYGPVQFRYLKGLKKEIERCCMKQGDYYERLPVQEEVLHANTQLHLLFMPASVIV